VTGLVRAEVRRLTSRRFVRIVAAIVLAITVIALVRTFATSSAELSPRLKQEIATRQAAIEFECAGAKDRGEIPGDVDCREFFGDAFFDDPRLHGRTALPSKTKAVTLTMVLIAFVVGATYVGAEWSAGTMQALLFWEPRRRRVLLAKALALAGVVVASALALHALVYGATYLTAATRGTTTGVTAGLHLSNLLLVGRGLFVAVCVGLIGFAICGVARLTAAALGVSFVYFFGEIVVTGLRPGWSRFLVLRNIEAVVNLRAEVLSGNSEAVTSGGQVEYTQQLFFTLTAARGAITLALYTALAVGAFYLAFTRRDVT
jgi:ABC-2 type transport system permease protein